MRIFIAGSTGYTGREVVSQLSQRDCEVIAHIRPGSSSFATYQPKYEAMGITVDTTPWDADAMTQTMKALAPDVVFFLIGTTKKRMTQVAKAGGNASAADYEAVDYGLAHLLLQSCLAASTSDKPRFVYLSSMGVGPRAMGDYLKVRWRFEEELRACGLQHIIARPGIITGDDRDESRPMETLAGKASDVIFKGLGALGAKQLEKRYRATDAHELAGALIRAAFDDSKTAVTLEAEALKSVQ